MPLPCPPRPSRLWPFLLAALLVLPGRLALAAVEDDTAADRQNFAPPGQTPQYAPDRTCDVLHLRGELTLDPPAGTVRGTVTLTLRGLDPEAMTFRLDAAEMEITRVRLGGHEVPYDYDGAKLTVRFEKPLPRERDNELAVSYLCHPRTGMFFVAPLASWPGGLWNVWTQGEQETNHYWIPCWDYPNERQTSELFVTVPAGYTVIGNGRLVAHEAAGAGLEVWHWREEVPHVSYLLSIVAGKYEKVADKFGQLPVEYYVPPDRVADAREFFPATLDMLKDFERRTGQPYPYEKYAQSLVEEFVAGGMENISATTLALASLPARDQAADRRQGFESLVAHELAHMWFGDYLTCRDWSHIWLNEGFATFFQAIWFEDHYGEDEFRYEMLQKAGAYQAEAERYDRATVTDRYAEAGDMFDSHTYPRGAWILEMLRREIGEDAFWAGMRRYVREHARGVVETDDLRRAMEEESGRNLLPFFRQWAFGPGYPRFKVALRWDEKTSEAVVSVDQTQTGPGLPEAYAARTALLLRGPFGTRREPVRLESRHEEFRVKLDGRPTSLALDPDEAVLKTVDYDLPQDALLASLKEGEVVERCRAAQQLAAHTTPDVLRAILEAARGDRFWGVRVSAVRALGRVPGDPARDGLTALLAGSDPRVRAAAAEALGNFVLDPAAAAALIRAAGSDASSRTRAAALRALGRVRLAETALPALEAGLTTRSTGDDVRNAALEALGTLADPRGLPLLEAETTLDRPWLVRRTAYLALGNYAAAKDDAEVVDFLSRLADRTEIEAARSRLMDALGSTGDRRALPVLERMRSREPDSGGRRRADKAMDRLRSGSSPRLSELEAQIDELRH